MFLGIIGLSLEILYYALFIKSFKTKSNFIKLLVMFIIINIFFAFVGSNTLLSYLLLIILIVLGLKYFIKANTTVYDMFFIFIMMIAKAIIETIFVIVVSLLIKDAYIMAILVGLFKIPLILILRNKIYLLYKNVENYWNNNRFFIRYIFTILMFSYVIISCVFIILN